jgi:transposase
VTFEEEAKRLNVEEIADVLSARAALASRNNTLQLDNKKLQWQVAYLQRQLYGTKSERRVPEAVSPDQKSLFEIVGGDSPEESEEVEIQSHTRKKRKQFSKEDEEAPEGTFPTHLRREEGPEIDDKPEGYSDDELEVVSEKITERLAENPGEQYVIVYRRRVFKVKESGELICVPAPEHVFGQKCKVHESFLVLMVIKKFLWHLPLYRQHQMLKLEGIKLSRPSLANWVIQLAKLLEPIAVSLKRELLQAEYLHVDNSPGKVGRGKKKKGKSFDTGYYWPLLNPDIGVHFSFSRTKAYQAFEPIIEGFKGTLVSDAEEIFEKYTTAHELGWQLCWHHSRRNFIEAEISNPVLAARALDYIRELYRVEREIKKLDIQDAEKISRYRQEYSQPILEAFKQWLKTTAASAEALTSEKLSQAISYLYTRWDAAVLFVMNGNLPPDNGADEREIKPLKLGLKNYLFCASEVGAEAAAIFYSLIASAKIHGIHPYYYLLDLLTRIDQPGITADDLIPHNWKKRFFEDAVPEKARNVLK